MNKPTRFYSNRQEKQVAKTISGKQTANSGATPFSKGDVVSDAFLIECKTKVKATKSFTVKEDWLLKLNEEAFAMGKQGSALCFDFGERNNNRYYIISERLFLRLKSYMEEE